MSAVMLVGSVDLTDATKYRFSQSDDGGIWEHTDAPRRNSLTADTLIVSRSQKIADILTFFIVCLAADGDPDTAETNYQALQTQVVDGTNYWTSRGAQGSVKTVQKGVDGQSSALTWTIKRHELHRQHHAWDGIPMIGCTLVVTVVEGSVTLASSAPPAAPVELRLQFPSPTLRTGTLLDFSRPRDSLYLPGVL